MSVPGTFRAATISLACLTATTCGPTTTGTGALPVAGVPRTLAEQRAATISNLSYGVSLSIPEARQDPIIGTIVVEFDLSEATAPLVFDFAQPAESLLAVRAGEPDGDSPTDGQTVETMVQDEHVIVPASALRQGANRLAIDFVAGDGSLNRNDEYLYTLFVPDRARVAMPVFDQPDLKARVAWTLEVPSTWEAIANGELLEHNIEGERATFVFEQSAPISTYLFAFTAGAFQEVSAEHNGRTLRLLHRETDTAKVDRNIEAIFELHATALDWLEEYTGIAYPFQKFGLVAMPAFQYGGMEHPGAIFYVDRTLFLDETATQNQYLERASVIAHETAHMWFGNLVTMEWFNDVWMKEVFANFMAAKIVNPSFPEVDHDLRFMLAHYPVAYAVDRTDGANPIRQTLENLNEAGAMYGAIIYQKAPVVMKHLELMMGEIAFRDGLREYLGAHRYANATWPDLVEVMDARADEDLIAWSEIWVNEPGRPTVEVELQTDGEVISALTVSQKDPLDRNRVWNQRLSLLLGTADGEGRSIDVHITSARTEVAEAVGAPLPDFVLANGGGVGYGGFLPDERSRDWLLTNLPTLPRPQLRAIAWLSLWDSMLEGQTQPMQLLDLALNSLPSESDELNIDYLLGVVSDTYWRYIDATSRSALAPRIEALAWELLETAPRATLKGSFFATYRDVALTAPALERIRAIWSGELEVEGLKLSETDLMAIAQGLAVRRIPDAEAILDAQRQRIDNPDNQRRFDFVRPALSADDATRQAFFESLADPANREQEPWVLEAVEYLNHPLRAPGSLGYIRPALEELEEIQRTAGIFFPLDWLNATFAGHSSREAADTVRAFLSEHSDLAPRLRGKLLQAADPLFRAAAIIHGGDR